MIQEHRGVVSCFFNCRFQLTQECRPLRSDALRRSLNYRNKNAYVVLLHFSFYKSRYSLGKVQFDDKVL